MEQHLSFAKKIGSFVSSVLLGETKEIIIRMDERLLNVSKRVDLMEPDLKSLRERFAVIEDRMQILWKDEITKARSPRALNERGMSILLGSGIKEVMDTRKSEILAAVQVKSPKNPYDAENYILEVVAEFKKDNALVESLKTGAFSVGSDIDTVLLVGGMYIRDQIFADLGFSIK